MIVVVIVVLVMVVVMLVVVPLHLEANQLAVCQLSHGTGCRCISKGI